MKADLAIELKLALANKAKPDALGDWLKRNAEEVLQALDWSDDLVEIEQIDLADLPKLLEREKAKAKA